MDEVFKALADPGRRKLLDSLNTKGGQTLGELCSVLDMARQSVSKHLAVLEASNLVTTVWRGREKLHYLNAAPISEISDRWINRYHRRRVSALAGLKRALEDPSMARPEFVYVTYIRTTPEHLWRALTDPEFTARYWGRTYETDWKKGSRYELTQSGIRVDGPEQVILEADPPRRLSYTWPAMSADVAQALGWSDDYIARITAEPGSRVTFEIEPEDDANVRLTVIHDGLEEGSLTLESISGGWPRVLANLKTLLETGEAEPWWACK
ncbi:MAG TPA: metalloregulator ArsR/SmtB family transcription factor [Acidimicrobiales bacterium]|nr:metalloregulator ArsR/SmtB family transcription factor [Acidimicrobiales bacterium]